MEQILVNGVLLQVSSGELVSKILQEHAAFKMPCAGQGHCGKCKVYAKGQLSIPDAVEVEKLTEAELEKGIRLACRTRILGEAVISTEYHGTSKILLGEQIIRGEERLFQSFGVAIDIGTTTIAAQLYGENGLLAQAGCDNPQGAFGADVISRIERSLAGEGRQLAEAVRRGINGLIGGLCAESGCSPEQIDTMVITGNTAMLYLLTERNPESLSHAPFQADWLAGEWIRGEELALLCKEARVWLPPCISAFVGADIVSALMSVDILKKEDKRLLVDIGTNGEIALWDQGRLLCCATAAGPVFEGAGISCGMQGEDGAISHVSYEPGKEGFAVEVIGDGAPRGICGSGVIDAVWAMLESEQLDETGYLEDEVVVISGDITMNQEDIRKVQLAKSAICAGIETLLKRSGQQMEALDEFLVAGGFGAFLNLEAAGGIGLLPKEKAKTTTVCGNAALAGAAKALWDISCDKEAADIIAVATPLNLAEDPFFAERYMEGMFF